MSDQASPARFDGISVGDELPSRDFECDNVQLMLYNAALWNGHRIHFDEPYATQVEGYPGLVIAGPLLGDWLHQCVEEWLGEDGRIVSIEYSNRVATYLGEILTSGGIVTECRPNSHEALVDVFVKNVKGEVVTPGQVLVRFGDAGNFLRGKVAIVGVADTEVGVVPGRTPMELCVEAALHAIADAGLEKGDVDGLVTCNAMAQPMLYHAEATAEYLQIFPRYCFAAGAGGGTTFSVIHHAVSAIVTGMADTVVVAMADSMRSGLTRDQAMQVQASTGHPEFEQPYGLTVPAYYALIAQAHMAAFGTSMEQFAGIAVGCREHARLNPTAQKREPITVEDVLNSRMIADPLHLLDCSLVSDGGSALVLTSAERAVDLPNRPVYILGAGEGHSHEHISAARSLTTSAAKEAGERAYAMSGLGPADMHFAQLYDCFTPTVLVELEDLGFCEKGEGGLFVETGALLPGGSLPLNTHGGLLSHCHPGNPGSMFALTESVWQLRAEAGARQVSGAKNALVHAQGGIMSSHTALVLSGEGP